VKYVHSLKSTVTIYKME